MPDSVTGLSSKPFDITRDVTAIVLGDEAAVYGR